MDLLDLNFGYFVRLKLNIFFKLCLIFLQNLNIKNIKKENLLIV